MEVTKAAESPRKTFTAPAETLVKLTLKGSATSHRVRFYRPGETLAAIDVEVSQGEIRLVLWAGTYEMAISPPAAAVLTIEKSFTVDGSGWTEEYPAEEVALCE